MSLLKIDVNELAEGENLVDYELTVKELNFNDKEVSLTSEIVVNLKVTKLGSKVFMDGEFKVDAELSCSRCLENYKTVLNGNLMVEFRKKIANSIYEEDSDEETLEYTGNVIDFTDGLRQEIILAVPFKPLCKENCKGLCIECGQNLNYNSCVHVKERK